MSEFKGRQCDGCGKPVPLAEVTKKTVRFEGSTVEGQRVFDLCPPCAKDDTDAENLDEIKRIKRFAVPEPEVASTGADPGVSLPQEPAKVP